eukprot:comp13783_c2_seq1/m.9483 comp13783_c2_seq1/g.9483  ORF comp13783_c2_seq1/g.9483 comp13783_c2_seq1/m.9483 type:complete len:102 (+) comp13783_c2_seq1:964-1269(+)
MHVVVQAVYSTVKQRRQPLHTANMTLCISPPQVNPQAHRYQAYGPSAAHLPGKWVLQPSQMLNCVPQAERGCQAQRGTRKLGLRLEGMTEDTVKKRKEKRF